MFGAEKCRLPTRLRMPLQDGSALTTIPDEAAVQSDTASAAAITVEKENEDSEHLSVVCVCSAKCSTVSGHRSCQDYRTAPVGCWMPLGSLGTGSTFRQSCLTKGQHMCAR